MHIGNRIKYFTLLLVIVIFNNSFAAGTNVSGNDGSAFITKAEFDSLKSSFQSQLDTYNTSIDSKIDTAIAAYLEGINLATERNENQICYTLNGILSPRASYKDLNFVEGQLCWNVNWFILSRGGGGKITITGKTPTDFKEMGINDIYNNGTKYVASWTGYVTDKQQMTQTCNHLATGEYFGNFVDTQKMQVNAHGIVPFSNIRWNTDTTARNMMSFSFSGYNTEPWGTWSFVTLQSTATRTVSDTTNQNIIITPASVLCKRFSRLDDVYDWTNCEDPDTTTFRKLTDGNSTADIQEYGFASVKMDFYRGSVSSDGTGGLTYKTNKTGGFKKGKALTNNNDVYYKNDSGGAVKTKPSNWDAKLSWQPYFGFCNYYTNYNQLYIKQYDNLISDMKAEHSDLNVIKDADGVEHLALNAGAPVVKAKKDEKVQIDVKFADLTKDYDMWFKLGSFSYSKDPSDDINLIKSDDIKYLKEVGGKEVEVSIDAGKAANSFKIPSGASKIQITMPNDGYIFTKWQYADTSIVGGGTYKPVQEIKIVGASH